MKSSRQHLLEYLRKTKGATAEEMAAFLGVAPATVRRHLDILQRDHMVTFQVVRRKTGRPHHLYCLTDQGRDSFSQNYGRLLSHLLLEMRGLTAADLRGRDGPGVLDVALERLASRLAAAYAPRLGNHSPESRLQELVALLNEEGYLTEWRREDTHYQLLNFHCPYFQVAWDNNALCCLDATLLQKCLQLPVTQEQSLAQGSERCLFRIGLSEGAEKGGVQAAERPDRGLADVSAQI